MDVTIIGLPRTGKTTLLQALAGAELSGGGIATVRVPDERLDKLSKIFEPKKDVYVEIRAREAAWPGVGGSRRKSEMEKYINAIRGSQLFIHVIAAVQTPMMTAPANPLQDLQKLDDEMIFSDLVAIERILEQSVRSPLDPNLKKLLERFKDVLEGDQPLWTQELDEREHAMITGYNLITLTPQLVVVNTAEDDEGKHGVSDFGDRLHGRHVASLCFTTAKEVSFLPTEEQELFAQELGLDGPAAARVSQEAFRQLDLISFLTVGADECRAWAIRRGTVAKSAAGVIHTDFEKGFIRAAVVSYEEFMQRKSLKACREGGVLRLEGKEYVVQDGDIIEFRFNV
jgi:ribosome-binding ATPase